MTLHATCLGFPRIGRQRELKRALEGYWAGTATAVDLQRTAATLRRSHWTAMRAAGMTSVPTNDFALYDHVLDTALLFGVVPQRFAGIAAPLERYFAMARGRQDRAAGLDVAALEMTKWFDTNYHYLVPELEPDQHFTLDPARVIAEVDEARALGVEPRPVVPGPFTFLKLARITGPAADPLSLLGRLLDVYVDLLGVLCRHGVTWVQIDEPCLVTDLDATDGDAYRQALAVLAGAPERPKMLLATYFGALGDNLPLAVDSGFDGLHIDGVRGAEEVDRVIDALPGTMVLSLGLVDGRNVWRTDMDAAASRLRRAVAVRGEDHVWVSSSCSLLHVPVDLTLEPDVDPELRSWLAFALQKLDEIAVLAAMGAGDGSADPPLAVEARAALAGRRTSVRTSSLAVRERLAALEGARPARDLPFVERAAIQARRLQLPHFPTTTIGSFPQTRAIREARAAWRTGRIGDSEYQSFLEGETRACVARQEDIGLDVLVHGEFERTDMVEYFGEQLEGFAFTRNGWVQSYGSRCVKPPILYGDVARQRPMTVAWARFAQSLTKRPMKGMLTGPVTILQWSFVRDDQPRRDTCLQIALALQDEVRDLEAAGIPIVQVDEPALREGLPLRRTEWQPYLEWAVLAFRVATSGVSAATQIHTHMCYAEFGDILPAIAALDADVISIETSRSAMQLLDDFGAFSYPNAIGPGVYDIHSPRIPTVDEMVGLLRGAAAVIAPDRLWVNPDCGLKTRAWPEVDAALRAMVAAAAEMRRRLSLPEPSGDGA